MHGLYNKGGMGTFWSRKLTTDICVTFGCVTHQEGLLKVSNIRSDVRRVRLNENYPVSYNLCVY